MRRKFIYKAIATILACILMTAAVPVYALDEENGAADLSGAVLSEDEEEPAAAFDAAEEEDPAVPAEGGADASADPQDGETPDENTVTEEENDPAPAEEGGTDAPADGEPADGNDEDGPQDGGEEETAFPETGFYVIRADAEGQPAVSWLRGEDGDDTLSLSAEGLNGSQVFRLEKAEDGSFAIRPFYSEDPLYLFKDETDGSAAYLAGVPMEDADGRFLLENVSADGEEIPRFAVISVSDPELAWDTAEHETADGTALVPGIKDAAGALRWIFEEVPEETLTAFVEEASEEEIPEENAEPEEEDAEETAEPEEEEPGEAADEELMTTLADFVQIEDGVYTIASSKDEGQVFDIAGGSTTNGGNLQLYRSNKSLAQLFSITHIRNNYYKIVNLKSGLSLDVAGAKAEKGTNVQQWRWNGSAAQTWRLKQTAAGYYEFYSTVGTNFVLDCTGGKTVNYTNIQIWKRNGSASQQFKLTPVSEEEVVAARASAETVYTIRTAVGTKFVLDVYNGSMVNGGNVQIYTENNTNAQKWRLVKDGSYYTIVSVKSGKALDVKSNGKTDGTNVQQWTPNGSAAQKWKLVSAGNGWYHIVASNGLYLNVWDGIAKNGTNVCLWTKDGSTEQKFKLEKTRIDPTGLFTGSDGVTYNAPEEPVIANSKTYGPQRPQAGRTLGNYLRNAMVPVGRTLYIWGGGHNGSSNAGSVVDCSVIGYRATWEYFYLRKAAPGYNYLNYQYQYGSGLDCSGFVGWTLYNTVYSKNGQNWVCWTSGKTALKYIEEEWATEGYDTENDKIKKKFYPGDVVSMNGHVWISLGQCSDGSVLLVHSSPNGVQIAGTVTSKGQGNSEAYQLADRYMKKYYPNWPYATVCCGKNYLKGLISVAHWRVSGSDTLLTDPENYQKMTPAQVMQNLLGNA